METKYKGYEELLDVDEDDPDILIPRDVQGSVRALNYALAHPLIFSESHGTYKERRMKKEKVIYMLILWYKHLGKANSEAPVFRVVRALNYSLVHPLIFSESHGTYKQKRLKKAEVVYMSILNQSCLGCLKARPFHG